jgi:hypothetical protein
LPAAGGSAIGKLRNLSPLVAICPHLFYFPSACSYIKGKDKDLPSVVARLNVKFANILWSTYFYQAISIFIQIQDHLHNQNYSYSIMVKSRRGTIFLLTFLHTHTHTSYQLRTHIDLNSFCTKRVLEHTKHLSTNLYTPWKVVMSPIKILLRACIILLSL